MIIYSIGEVFVYLVDIIEMNVYTNGRKGFYMKKVAKFILFHSIYCKCGILTRLKAYR